MFVDILEALRCPRPHDESQLVVAAGRVADRHILSGTLGCPLCGAEFKIVDGITTFGIPVRPTPPAAPDEASGLRIAAFLELTDPRGFALLCGQWGAQLDPVQRVADTPIALWNPPLRYGGEPSAVMLCDGGVPLAAGSVRAAALDGDVSQEQVASAVRAVREGGRLIGPAAMPLPAGVNEVARDQWVWVGEKPGGVRFVELKRG
jgi:uncharacterized protein YbaR (Trm112 family)